MWRIHFAGRRAAPIVPLAQACEPPTSLTSEKNATDGIYPQRFAALFAEAPRLWRAVELAEADLVVYPHSYTNGSPTANIAAAAKARNVPCVFFDGADDPTPAVPPYGVVYRHSILAHQRTAREHGMPAFCDDMQRVATELAVAAAAPTSMPTKSERPRIGFCGFVGTTWSRTLYQWLGRSEKARGLILRQRVLRQLERDRRLDCQFIRRAQFWAGAGVQDRARAEQVHREFVANLAQTDYTVCLRGAGNFSFRFYETLALGRIPVFIDTACVLPFERDIDWRRHGVWIDESELGRAGELVWQFHQRLSPREFEALKAANRQLWLEWLAPLPFYRRVLDRVMRDA